MRIAIFHLQQPAAVVEFKDDGSIEYLGDPRSVETAKNFVRNYSEYYSPEELPQALIDGLRGSSHAVRVSDDFEPSQGPSEEEEANAALLELTMEALESGDKEALEEIKRLAQNPEELKQILEEPSED